MNIDRILLCAGKSSRFEGLAEGDSKCLVEIRGKSLLRNLLENTEKIDFPGTTYVIAREESRKGFYEAIEAFPSRGNVRLIYETGNSYHTPTSTLVRFLRAEQGRVSEYFLALLGDIWFSDMRFFEEVSANPYENMIAISASNKDNKDSSIVVTKNGFLDEVPENYRAPHPQRWGGMAFLRKGFAINFREEKKLIREIAYWSDVLDERVRCVELDYCANMNTRGDHLSIGRRIGL